MPRRRPQQVRATQRRRALSSELPRAQASLPQGLSERGQFLLLEFEIQQGRQGFTAKALELLKSFQRDPAHRLRGPEHGCGEMGCCPQPHLVRDFLERALAALPPQDARPFRRKLAELDEQW